MKLLHGLAVRALWFILGGFGILTLMGALDANHIMNGREPQFLRDEYYIHQGLM